MRKVLTDKPVWRRRIRLLKCPWDAVLSPRFPSPSRGGVRGGVNFSPAPPPRATILPHPCPLPFEGRGKEACPRLPFPSIEQSRKSARVSPPLQGEGLGVGSARSPSPQGEGRGGVRGGVCFLLTPYAPGVCFLPHPYAPSPRRIHPLSCPKAASQLFSEISNIS